MSEIVVFRLAIKASSLTRLWQREFLEDLTRMDLRFDQDLPGPCAITSMDGNSLIWFESGASAWDWLSRHDGLMVFWGSDGLSVRLSTTHQLIGTLGVEPMAEISVSLDLPSRGSTEDKRLVNLGESLAGAVVDQCEVVRGLAYDENFFEQVTKENATLVGDTSGLPEVFGYWNAFSLVAYSDEARRYTEQLGAVLEMRNSSFVIRFASWPWEAPIDILIDVSHTLLPTMTDVVGRE